MSALGSNSNLRHLPSQGKVNDVMRETIFCLLHVIAALCISKRVNDIFHFIFLTLMLCVRQEFTVSIINLRE